jgi:thiol-disulfide isomerase/thioredoxin
MKENCKYLKRLVIAVWGWLTVFVMATGINSFSQISQDDSTGYTGVLKMNEALAKDIKGKPLSGFIVKDKNGVLLTADELGSKITFINFWFLACAPCVAEFPALEKFYNNNKSRKDFRFISITFESESVIEETRKKHNLTYPVYRLSSDSCRKMIGRLGYPATFIVNKNLEVIYAVCGGPTDRETADKYLNHFIQAEIDKQLK